jgi:hypothetical protein
MSRGREKSKISIHDSSYNWLPSLALQPALFLSPVGITTMKTNFELEALEVCACCGVAAVDDIKLKMCDGGCDLVKYCRDDCQTNHREQHEDECKKRRAELRDDIQRRATELRQTFLRDELRDKQLFEPDSSSYRGECPICCLPLSLEPEKSSLMPCCCKIICNGCRHANKKREREQGLGIDVYIVGSQCQNRWKNASNKSWKGSRKMIQLL